MAQANKKARALRKAMTAHEARLWTRLRLLKRQGLHFRRQVPIDGYIVDFACYGARLVIEVDGSQHGLPDHSDKDAVRDAHLTAAGFRVLRFWNSDINANFDGVLEAILAAIGDP